MLRRMYVSASIACILTTGCENKPINAVNTPPVATERPSEGRPHKVDSPSESVVKRFGGREVAIVANSAKTTAFRVGKLPKGKFDYDPDDENPPVPVTEDYPITAGPVTVPEDISAEVVDALLDSDTYDKSQGNFCDFEPGVRFTFNSNDGQVDVLICFECDQLNVHRNGKHVGGGYSEFARPVFLRAAKRLFPNDESIQGLPDKAH